jgi:hypothetical protein
MIDYVAHLAAASFLRASFIFATGVRDIQLPDTEIENLPRHFFYVVGLDFQPDRPGSP